MVITTEAEWKAWVEDMTGGHNGGTCQRPDIASYDVCDDCPFTAHCLCHLNTTLNLKRKRRKLRDI